MQENENKHNMSTLHQLQQFGKNSKGSYEGSCIHDDIAVTCLFVSIALEQELFKQWCEEWLEVQYNTPNIEKVRWMLQMYVETEPTISDEEFQQFFNMASGHLNQGITTQQNTYSQIGKDTSRGNLSSGTTIRQPMTYRNRLNYPKKFGR